MKVGDKFIVKRTYINVGTAENAEWITKQEYIKRIVDNVLFEFTDLSGEYIEAKKDDVLDRLCEVIGKEMEGEK